MYVPPHFSVPNQADLHELITAHPFGVMFTHGKNGADANHLPFELHRSEGPLGTLHAHVARANPVWQEMSNGDEVLVVFSAGNAYISPNWYPSKHVAHKQVPTWNYMVAHAHGRITIRDDERYVRGLVARLTRTHEASEPRPWKMTDSSPDFVDTLLKAIVGVEIEITRLVGKSKLSQNKETADIVGAGEAVNRNGAHPIGVAMLAAAAGKAGKPDA